MADKDKEKFGKIFKGLRNAKNNIKSKAAIAKMSRQKHVLIEDLYKKQCRFADAAIPYANAYAYDIIQKYFGDITTINMDDFSQMGVVLYILDNQFDEKLADMTHEELSKEGQLYLMNIPLDRILVYVELILQFFEDVKKKLYIATLEKLETARAMVKKITDLENSVSDLQSDSESQ